MVLADKGICLIDEFDNMSVQDRAHIHEIMEQQSVSIAKAGIVVTIQARCAVIAAANPIKGYYDPNLTFADNVDMSEPIMSRFDLLCVVKDKFDAEQDQLLARFVVNSHIRNHPTKRDARSESQPTDTMLIPQDLLKKYIVYAKENVHPQLKVGRREEPLVFTFTNTFLPLFQDTYMEKISTVYTELRRISKAYEALPITVRTVESIIRMSEAHARMHLRNHVQDVDVNMSIRMTVESFIQAQNHSVMARVQSIFGKYLAFQKGNLDLLFFILQQLTKEYWVYSYYTDGPQASYVDINEEELAEKANNLNTEDLKLLYDSKVFKDNGYLYDAARKKIRHIRSKTAGV